MFNEITVDTVACGNIAYTNNIAIDTTALYNVGIPVPRLGTNPSQENMTFKANMTERSSLQKTQTFKI